MEKIQFMPVFYYFIEAPNQIYQSQNPSQEAEEQGRQKKQSNQFSNTQKNIRWSNYLRIFQNELQKNKKKYQKKVWESWEDHILVQLKEKGLNWVDISKNISNTKPQICKRRYVRLTSNEQKWPKNLDNLIIRLFQQENKTWQQIYDHIFNQMEHELPLYSQKKIKQRYFLYLRKGIDQREWEVQEDIRLLTLVKQKGRKWKKMTQNFNGRTELQLKNRYNGSLKLIQKRVLRKLNQLMRSIQSNKNKLEKNI